MTLHPEKGLTTANVVRVVGLELRLAWIVAGDRRPRTGAYHVELFRVAALVAEMSTPEQSGAQYDWAITVANRFNKSEIGPGSWHVSTAIRIEPYLYDGKEDARAKAILESVAALL
jgi:hypothetical protein